MEALFLKTLNMTIAASWLILSVILLRLILKKAPKWASCLLWAVVAVRLICPFSIESSLSLVPSVETVSPDIFYVQYPAVQINTFFPGRAVNISLPSQEPWQSASPLQIWAAAAAFLWFAGIAAMLIYAAVSFLLLRKRVKVSFRLYENIYICDAVKTPFILGMVNPRIYLPSDLDGMQRENVLAHERAHLARRDHFWKPLGFLLLCIYWFNPLCWAAYILLCRDIELACDEKVIKTMKNDDLISYSETLLSCSVSHRSLAACPLAFGEAGVKERVKNVLNYKKPAFRMIAAAVIICLALAVCFLTDPATDDTVSVSTVGNADGPSELIADTFFKINAKTVDGTKQYYLTPTVEGVAEIAIAAPGRSGGCRTADGSLYARGEQILLEPLNGFSSLDGVTLTLLNESGDELFSFSCDEKPDDAGQTG